MWRRSGETDPERAWIQGRAMTLTDIGLAVVLEILAAPRPPGRAGASKIPGVIERPPRAARAWAAPRAQAARQIAASAARRVFGVLIVAFLSVVFCGPLNPPVALTDRRR